MQNIRLSSELQPFPLRLMIHSSRTVPTSANVFSVASQTSTALEKERKMYEWGMIDA